MDTISNQQMLGLSFHVVEHGNIYTDVMGLLSIHGH